MENDDPALSAANDQVVRSMSDERLRPKIQGFIDDVGKLNDCLAQPIKGDQIQRLRMPIVHSTTRLGYANSAHVPLKGPRE